MSAKRIALLIWKEFTQFRRDPLMLRLVIVMPLLQLMMFGYVVGADVRNIPTAIVDADQTPMSRQVAAAFTSSGYFVVTAHPTDERAIQPLLDRSQIQVAVLLPAGLEADITRGRTVPLEIVVDGSDSKTATRLRSSARSTGSGSPRSASPAHQGSTPGCACCSTRHCGP
jgi:ABC-2 type transport system permease protein